MRLLFLIHAYPPDVIGGHEIRCQRTAEGLRQRGHEVLVLTTFRRENGPRKEGHVWRLLRSKWSEDPKRSAFKWVFVYRHNVKVFNRVVKEFQPEIICRWGLNWCTAAFVNYVHEHTPCPIVTFIGGVPIGRNWSVLEDLWTHFCKTKPKALIRRWVKNLLVRIASIWIPTSPQNVVYGVATFLSHFDLRLALKYGMQVTKPVVIYAGVDVQKFSPRSPKSYQHPPRFFYAARLDPDKDSLTIVTAMGKLLQQGMPIRGTIAGGDSLDRPYREKVLSILKMLNGFVQFKDRVPPAEIGNLLHQHDVFIFASYPGWIGNAALEAMACGLAPIISSFEDVDNILCDGENCLLYPFGDADALAGQMERLIRDPALVVKLGQNAQRLVHERFTLKRYLDETEELLKSVIRKA